MKQLKDKKQQACFYLKIPLDITCKKSDGWSFEKQFFWLKFDYDQFNKQKWETDVSKKSIDKKYNDHSLVYVAIPLAIIFLIYQWCHTRFC